MHPLYREDWLSPTNDQCLDGCDHLVSAGGSGQLAFSQVEGLSGDPQRLAFGGTTTTICHEKPTGVPLMGGHRWRVRAGFAARSAGLAAGRHPEVGIRVP
ncbi:MAG: hypothetical protein M0Z42_08850, partial [Actinomycetota bacterium]|nr:hypothetical protein [Actinomycetota bacterium]